MAGQFNVLRVADVNAVSGDTCLISGPVSDYLILVRGLMSGGAGAAAVFIRPNGDGAANYAGEGVIVTGGVVNRTIFGTTGMTLVEPTVDQIIIGEMRIHKVGNYWCAEMTGSVFSNAGAFVSSMKGATRWNSAGAALAALTFQVDASVALRRFTGRVAYYGVDS